MVDNLFIVESPLQALIAVELSLKFEDERSGVIYRLSGANRKRNDEQIEAVIEYGNWSFSKGIILEKRNAFFYHLLIRKVLKKIRIRFRGQVKQLFLGDFHSQWMHLSRTAVNPDITILIDDGAATLNVRNRFTQQGIFFPENLWKTRNFLKELTKNIIYFDFINKEKLSKPLFFASSFLKSESIYLVDFSALKERFKKKENEDKANSVLFFGAKYSEAKIVSFEYELIFISKVKDFYGGRNLSVTYCAHRDESDEKLNFIESQLGLVVVKPCIPAELYMLSENQSVAEIASAYSSVLNNMKVLFPEKTIRSFMFMNDEINAINKDAVLSIYEHYRSEGILIQDFN
ncbi:polysialyltransferase family glycosyltransferase [Idiomarina loihiensis]|uniref:polysialyltransferase family glycosyltransferase n=1 Tax=Idiomarina loihiensis TaxID=135577 RepID=UPI0031592CEE